MPVLRAWITGVENEAPSRASTTAYGAQQRPAQRGPRTLSAMPIALNRLRPKHAVSTEFRVFGGCLSERNPWRGVGDSATRQTGRIQTE